MWVHLLYDALLVWPSVFPPSPFETSVLGLVASHSTSYCIGIFGMFNKSCHLGKKNSSSTWWYHNLIQFYHIFWDLSPNRKDCNFPNQELYSGQKIIWIHLLMKNNPHNTDHLAFSASLLDVLLFCVSIWSWWLDCSRKNLWTAFWFVASVTVSWVILLLDGLKSI